MFENKPLCRLIAAVEINGRGKGLEQAGNRLAADVRFPALDEQEIFNDSFSAASKSASFLTRACLRAVISPSLKVFPFFSRKYSISDTTSCNTLSPRNSSRSLSSPP